MAKFIIIMTENQNTALNSLAEIQRDPPNMASKQDSYSELNTV